MRTMINLPGLSPTVLKAVKKWELRRVAYGGCVVTHADAVLTTEALPKNSEYCAEFTYFDINTCAFSTLESDWMPLERFLPLYKDEFTSGRRVWNSQRLFARTPDGREFWLLKL